MYIRRKVFSISSSLGLEEQREFGNAQNKALKKIWEKAGATDYKNRAKKAFGANMTDEQALGSFRRSGRYSSGLSNSKIDSVINDKARYGVEEARELRKLSME